MQTTRKPKTEAKNERERQKLQRRPENHGRKRSQKDVAPQVRAAGPAVPVRGARAVDRRGDDEVSPRQAPRNLRRRHQRRAGASNHSID